MVYTHSNYIRVEIQFFDNFLFLFHLGGSSTFLLPLYVSDGYGITIAVYLDRPMIFSTRTLFRSIRRPNCDAIQKRYHSGRSYKITGFDFRGRIKHDADKRIGDGTNGRQTRTTVDGSQNEINVLLKRFRTRVVDYSVRFQDRIIVSHFCLSTNFRLHNNSACEFRPFSRRTVVFLIIK